jgi:hypothetical protein
MSEATPHQRRAVPMILIVLATIVGVTSVLALWSKRQLLETETWATTSEHLIQDADIQAAVSNFLVNSIYDNVDVEAALADRLPPQAAPLAGPIAGALRNAAGDVALKALEQPKVQDLWTQASAAAQSKLIALLEDKGQFVATTGGVVTLDLKSLLESVSAQLGLPGKLVAKLPASASSIEVMKSDELAAAQTGLNLLKTAAYALTILTLLLYAAAIFLARARRRETLRAVGFSFIVIGAVVLFARNAAGDAVVNSLSGAASSDAAIRSAFGIGTSLLTETGQSIVTYGIVIVLAAWLAGPTRWATSARAAITPYLRQPGYAYGGLAALLLLFFWWDPVIATHRLVPSLLLIAFAALGTEMLRRQVIREFPDRVAPGPTATSTPAGDGIADERVDALAKLADLQVSGALSDDEFASEKQRVLAGSSKA